MGPITNYDLGKNLHREYEAEASRYWHQAKVGEAQTPRSIKVRLALAVSGMIMVVLPAWLKLIIL